MHPAVVVVPDALMRTTTTATTIPSLATLVLGAIRSCGHTRATLPSQTKVGERNCTLRPTAHGVKDSLKDAGSESKAPCVAAHSLRVLTLGNACLIVPLSPFFSLPPSTLGLYVAHADKEVYGSAVGSFHGLYGTDEVEDFGKEGGCLTMSHSRVPLVMSHRC